MTKRCRICNKPEGGEYFSKICIYSSPISLEVERIQYNQGRAMDRQSPGLGNLKHKAGAAAGRVGAKAGQPIIYLYNKAIGGSNGDASEQPNLPSHAVFDNTTSFGKSVDPKISGVINMMTGRRAYHVMRSNPNKVMRMLFGIKQIDVCRTCWFEHAMVTPDFPEESSDAGAPD